MEASPYQIASKAEKAESASVGQPALADSQAHTASELEPVGGRTRAVWNRLFAIAVAAMLALALIRPFFIPVVSGDHFLYLASHLVRGELSVNDIPNGYPDIVLWQGNKYLPFGPLPGVLLIPFLPLLQFLGTRDEVWVGLLLTLLNVFLLARVLTQIGVIGERRRWALLLFFGGTVYYAASVVAATWYFAHIVVTTCLLLAISEALGKKRMWLVGIFLGLAEATRFNLLFALPFFLWAIWHESGIAQSGVSIKRNEYLSKPALVRYAALLAGLAGPVLLLLAYNYVRFGNMAENGYAMTVAPGPLLEARGYGFFSLAHIPKNLYALLLQGPLAYPADDAAVLQWPYIQPSPWGMSIILTSPALLYAFRARWKEPLVRACWLTVLAICVPLITYYWTGWVQFGYRYALDFMPFLLMIAALGLPKPLTPLSRILIIASVVVNIWGALWLSKWV